MSIDQNKDKSIWSVLNGFNEFTLCFVSGLIIIVFLILPYLILRGDAHLIIHDNLDSDFIYLHLLKKSGLLFSLDGNSIVPQVMNGLPRGLFHSEFSFIRLLFYFLPSFWAYVVNSMIVRITGFIGMYLLARDYLIKSNDKLILLLFSAIFSVIPLYTLYGLSVMGQPLLIWAFINLYYNRKDKVNWIIIALFPFYAHFALIAPFILFTLFVYGLVKVFADKKINLKYFYGIFVLLVCFILANNITLKAFLFANNYVSHRSEWVGSSITLNQSADLFRNTFIWGQFHSSTIFALPIYFIGLIALLINIKDIRKVRTLSLIFLFIVLICVFYGSYPNLSYTLQNSLKILVLFQFNRFTFLLPFFLFVIFGLSIKFIYNKLHPVLILIFIMIPAFSVLLQNEEIRVNYAKIINETGSNADMPGFNHYYAPDLFYEITEYVNMPVNCFKVVSIGIDPSVAQFNGFYTLDSYQNNYPLSYKHEFRRIIEKELDKDADLKKYFDSWGSRCYLFSSELRNNCDWQCFKKSNVIIQNLDIDTEILKEMGCEYILSAVPVENHNKINLDFLQKFTNDNSIWNIYLYKII